MPTLFLENEGERSKSLVGSKVNLSSPQESCCCPPRDTAQTNHDWRLGRPSGEDAGGIARYSHLLPCCMGCSSKLLWFNKTSLFRPRFGSPFFLDAARVPRFRVGSLATIRPFRMYHSHVPLSPSHHGPSAPSTESSVGADITYVSFTAEPPRHWHFVATPWLSFKSIFESFHPYSCTITNCMTLGKANHLSF